MRILIVEDEKHIAEGVSRIITEQKRFAVQVKVAGNGKEGLKIAETFIPHLVISDIRMHHMNGLDMIETLISRDDKTRFVILSGYDKFEFAQRAIRYNVIDYLLKPLDKRRLLEIVQDVYMSLPKMYSKQTTHIFTEIPFLNLSLESEDYPESLKKVLAYIQGNYMMDLSLQDISEEIMLHSSYISKLINQHIGQNFNYVLNHIRIKKACHLLVGEDTMTINEISYLVGFSSSRRMHEAFRQYLSMTPTEFKNGVKDK